MEERQGSRTGEISDVIVEQGSEKGVTLRRRRRCFGSERTSPVGERDGARPRFNVVCLHRDLAVLLPRGPPPYSSCSCVFAVSAGSRSGGGVVGVSVGGGGGGGGGGDGGCASLGVVMAGASGSGAFAVTSIAAMRAQRSCVWARPRREAAGSSLMAPVLKGTGDGWETAMDDRVCKRRKAWSERHAAHGGGVCALTDAATCIACWNALNAKWPRGGRVNAFRRALPRDA